MDGAGLVRMLRWRERVALVVTIVTLLAAAWARADAHQAKGASQYDSIQLRPKTALESKSGGGASAPASGAMDASRVVVALGAVIALIFGVRWAGARFLGMSASSAAAGSAGAVRVLSKTVLSPKQQLMLVQVGKRVVLVANTGVQMNALCEITDPEEVAGLVGEVAGRRPERLVGTAASFLSAFGRAENSYGPGDVRFARDIKQQQSRNDPDGDVVPPTRAELAGLLEKVRLMSGAFRKT